MIIILDILTVGKHALQTGAPLHGEAWPRGTASRVNMIRGKSKENAGGTR